MPHTIPSYSNQASNRRHFLSRKASHPPHFMCPSTGSPGAAGGLFARTGGNRALLLPGSQTPGCATPGLPKPRRNPARRHAGSAAGREGGGTTPARPTPPARGKAGPAPAPRPPGHLLPRPRRRPRPRRCPDPLRAIRAAARRLREQRAAARSRACSAARPAPRGAAPAAPGCAGAAVAAQPRPCPAQSPGALHNRLRQEERGPGPARPDPALPPARRLPAQRRCRIRCSWLARGAPRSCPAWPRASGVVGAHLRALPLRRDSHCWASPVPSPASAPLSPLLTFSLPGL